MGLVATEPLSDYPERNQTNPMKEATEAKYLTIDEMLMGEATVSVELVEGKPPVSLTFNPNYYTSEYEVESAGLDLEDMPASKIAAQLHKILITTSFEKVPKLETLNKIWFGHLIKMYRAIQESSRGNLMAAATSDGG